VLCAITYVAVIALFIISGGATTFPMTTLPRRVPRDLRALVSSPVALVLALLLVFGAGSMIAYFPSEAPPRQAAAPLPPLTDKQRAELKQWWDVQPQVEIPVAADGAKVVIVAFSDFQCPHCRSAHEAYRDVLAKYTASGKVRFLAKHFPLEGECNPNAPNGGHMAACEAAAAVVMARATGKAVKMEDWLYDNQITLTPSIVREAARTVGGIADFNAGYAHALEEVKADAALGGLLGVSSTPTFFISGRKLPPGVIPPPYLDALIELELKAAK
jgi:protein-disulfide isomerase